MTTESKLTAEVRETLFSALSMVPFLWPFAEGIGPLGLEPRVRELAMLAVASSHGCSAVVKLHRVIGKAAGLTDEELEGELKTLTSAELAAVALARGTVSRPLPEEMLYDQADQYFTSEQIEQLQAVALAVDLDCRMRKTASSVFHSIVSGFHGRRATGTDRNSH